MPRIRVKDNKPRQGNRKLTLWNKLMQLNLLVYKLEATTRNAFIIITTDEIVEKLLSPKVKEALARDDFEVTTPPEYSSNRTIVLRNIDSIITEVESEELKLDIERRNEWAKITEIIKIPTAPKILKLKLENTDMVSRAVEKGMLVYNQSIPPSFINKEIYVHLDLCYVCYAYDHKTPECQTSDLKICSECAQTGHRYNECTSSTKKCINCNGNHRTMAAKCPKRKELIRYKEREIRERSRSRSRSQNRAGTYAQAVSGGQVQHSGAVSLTRDDMVKIYSSITYAHMMEGVLPGTFHQNIEAMYKLNGLPPVKFPPYIPPPQIDPDQIEVELKKMRKALGIIEETQDDDGISQHEMDTDMATRKRSRPSISPSLPSQPERQVKARTEDQEIQEEGAVALLPQPVTPPRDPRLEKQELGVTQDLSRTSAQPRASLGSADSKMKQYEKYVRDMEFCFVKAKETIIRRGDSTEIKQLIKEGRVKYVYSNPEFNEADCRTIWERGLVNIKNVEMRSIPKEGYKAIEYNGKYISRESKPMIKKR